MSGRKKQLSGAGWDKAIQMIRDRNTPQWTNVLPTEPGIYWFRFVNIDGTVRPSFVGSTSRTPGCQLVEILHKDGGVFTALFGFHFEIDSKRNDIEWWPIRVQEPPE